MGKAQFLSVLPLRKSGRNGRRRGAVHLERKGIPSDYPASGGLKEERKMMLIQDDWEPAFVLGSFYWVDAEGNIMREMTIEEIEEISEEMEMGDQDD